MKKLLSILAFALIFVGGVFADSNIKITVKLGVRSAGRGYVTVTDKASQKDNYKNTEKVYTNTASGLWGGCSTHYIKTTPAYIHTYPSSDKYRFIGWSKGSDNPNNIVLGPDKLHYGPIGEEHCKCDDYTLEEVYYAHFEENKTLNITLIAPTIGGYYTAKHTCKGASREDKLELNGANVVDEGITNPSDFNYTLTAYSNDNYKFLRWRIEYEDRSVVYNNNSNTQIAFAQSGSLSCEFIEKKYAQFIIKGSSDAYYKLSDAILAAKQLQLQSQSSNEVIVVKESGELYPETENVSGVFDASLKTYTIPGGITLLVPGDNAYTVQMGELIDSDFQDFSDGNNAEFHEFRKLSVINGQSFDVYGNICVYAKVHCNFAAMGLPYQYGWIELGENSHITLQDRANLSALGYITGNPNNSSVTALKGSSVRELLQVADWRGGEGVSDAIGSSNAQYKIFPFSQYYLQNIETRLILKAGAVEHISCGASITLVGTVPINSTFVMPNSSSYESGLFRLGKGAQLIKYYDFEKDRQKYEIVLEDGFETASTSFGNVKIDLDLGLSGTSKLESSAYVMPINNNMDILVGEGIELEIPSDFAFLAGSTVKMESRTKVFTSNEASVFVYDAKEHHVKNNADKGSSIAIKNGYYYNYYGSQNASLKPVLNRPGGLKYPRTTAPAKGNNDDNTSVTTQWMQSDAVITINGQFTGALYTTGGGAQITSDGGGIIKFSQLVDTKKVYQFVQYADKGAFGNSDKVLANGIPLSESPLLYNADGSFSTEGVEIGLLNEPTRTYTYYKDAINPGSDKKGRWLHEVPDGSILSTNIEGETWEFSRPEVTTGELSFTLVAKNVEINSIAAVNFSGSRFALLESSNYSFESGVVSIPIKITPSGDHNATTEETVTITFNCTNTVFGSKEQISLDINLSATENYLPQFNINNKESETLVFTATIGEESESQKIMINPTSGNVTDRTYNEGKGYVTWTPATLSATSPFKITGDNYFEGVDVYYEPNSINGVHEQTLTLTATYADGVETVKQIVLKGNPVLADNLLKFVDDCEIYANGSIEKLFISIGNGTAINFTYKDNESIYKEESSIIQLVPIKDDDDNIIDYKLQVKESVNIITPQVITIKATQSANDKTKAGSDEFVVTVIPLVQWNWSKLYFGNTYKNPIIVKDNTTPWTLTYNDNGDCVAIPAENFTYDETNGYQVEVGTGDEKSVTFTFIQGNETITFTATVYADPRILDVCMRDENVVRTFEDVSLERINVEYNEGILFATTEEYGASWTMGIVGVPDKLEFIPQGTGKRWTIQESSDGTSWTTTYTESEIVLQEGQERFLHNLKPSTQQIRIICSTGAEQGKITDLCVYRLDGSVSADVEKLYLPITRDAQNQVTQSEKIVRLSYVSPESDLWLSVVDENNNTVADITLFGDNFSYGKLPKTTIDNIYREEAITVSRTSSYSTEGIVYLLVKDKDNQQMLKLPICLFNYPQPLPIRTAEWSGENAEKYNFYVTEHKQNVQFNTINQKFTFAGNGQRFITFAFRGGPSYISFESSLDFVPQDGVTAEELVLQEWYEYWTLEVTDGELDRSVEPEITAEVRDGKTYYNIRIAIPYTTKSLTLLNKRNLPVEIENIVVDGEAYLDLVFDNHTIENESEANFTPNLKTQDVVVRAINLSTLTVVSDNPMFTVKCGETTITSSPTELTSEDYPNVLGNYRVGDITFNITWKDNNAVEEGELIFTSREGEELGRVRLLGAKDYILLSNADETGIYTGVAENIKSHPFKDVADKYKFSRTQIDLTNTFDANGRALFDYLIVYGETSTSDSKDVISAPTTSKGSNAKTPYYIYRRVLNEETREYDRYQFVYDEVNVNNDEGSKAKLSLATDLIPHAAEGTTTDVDLGMQYIKIDEGEQLRVYMTGFCPYASTGYTKDEEGVWIFRGKKNAKLDVYLENCHIYSRNKTMDGRLYSGKFDDDARTFTGDFVQGSGGVLVFECNQDGEYLDSEAFQVTIHTRGNNLLKSNFGCFYQVYGMRAYQVSSPLQIRLTSDAYVESSKTELTLDDKWPTNAANYDLFKRTNGFLSLQKQENNAPSIDLGNANTIVNFRGGRVELQNAQNVSDKYKTTLAISHRTGIMATGGLEVQMAHGIGTDGATGGIVKFYDGTISVIRMEVDAVDQQYYLMDPQLDENGDTIKVNGKVQYSDWTSCLRCPQNTYVYGGSICMLRACMSVTSKGGAPKDGPDGRELGRFFYKQEYGYTYYNTANGDIPAEGASAEQWLVKPKLFPQDGNLFGGLSGYYTGAGYTYGLESVTPNDNGQLVLWLPKNYGGVKVEEDRYLTPWKACMTQIAAEIGSFGSITVGGTVGGDVAFENNEDVENLLYCDLDVNVYNVITENNGAENEEDIVYYYSAPVKVPEGFSMDGVSLVDGNYMRISPKSVGERLYQVTNTNNYEVNSKVYYISSATADVWRTFTAPFNVEKIWVVETSNEALLEAIEPTEEEDMTKREKILKTQATHNADFASFFGVAMALGSDKSFEQIYEDYIAWAMIEDKYEGAREDYTIRGKYELTPYIGTNWNSANFYLNHNDGNWIWGPLNDENGNPIVDKEGQSIYGFKTKWYNLTEEDISDGILLHQGETYSMLFPYCVGCDVEVDANGEVGTSERNYWDYWSGKLLVFESTQASEENPHIMNGSNYVAAERPTEGDWVFQNEVIAENWSEVVVAGNSTFANMITNRGDVFEYVEAMNEEIFKVNSENQEVIILPTKSFLYGEVPTPEGASVLSISRTGKINYRTNGEGNDDTNTGGHMPTVGDGSDIFVTATPEGIRIAVEEPQYVGVFAANGALLFNGWVDNAVDVALVNRSVYVVVGENNSVKVIY